MSIVSFREINQSQLSSVPISVGCITVCVDSGRLYKDTETEHKLLSEQILFVDELPIAPLSDKLYYFSGSLYLYINGDYLNISKNHTHKISDISDFPTSMPASDVYSWAKASTKPSYTASEVGLGNVPNVITNDQTPSYTESSTLSKLSSGEKLSVAFGKISKAVTDLISHIGDSVKHITSSERSSWNAAKTHADSSHAPSNAQANVIETVKVNGTALTLSSKAVNITVPTKVSTLTNDSGYITSSGTAKTISDTLPLSKGGTGATTASSARKNLGAIGFIQQSGEPSGQNVGDLWFGT